MHGAITKEDLAANGIIESNEVDVDQLAETQDDFMDTYLAINLDVKVRESHLQGRNMNKVLVSDS